MLTRLGFSIEKKALEEKKTAWRRHNILLVIILNAIITYASRRCFSYILSSFSSVVSLFINVGQCYCLNIIKTHFLLQWNPYTRYYVTWCVSLFPISFRFIYLHMLFSPSSFTIFFSEFFIFLRRSALFISCNIFLLFFICFFCFHTIFVFIFSYVYFVNFYEWKNCFFLSFVSLLRTEGETSSVYLLTNTEELFSSSKNILRYYFHFPFLCISYFSPSLLTFRLAHRLLFPSYSKQQLDSLPTVS